MPSIDLNADLGEECGDDRALLQVVTTANVAAGAHAGGGEVLHRTVRDAADAGVAVGVHPSYEDRAGFGRTSRLQEHDAASLAALIRHQSFAVAAACAAHGVAITHIKPHGALYHDVAADDAAARVVVSAVADIAADLGHEVAVVGAPSSSISTACAYRDIPFWAEAFVDRAYLPSGTLAPRSEPGAVLHDADAVVEQALALAMDGSVTATDGSRVVVAADTLCLHGDTPGAVLLAVSVRTALEAHGLVIAHPTRP